MARDVSIARTEYTSYFLLRLLAAGSYLRQMMAGFECVMVDLTERTERLDEMVSRHSENGAHGSMAGAHVSTPSDDS